MEGLDNIPPSGGVIVACNHISVLDPFAHALFVDSAGRKVRMLGKAEVFRVFGVGRILRGARQIPVQRGSADASRALEPAVDALRFGEAVAIYPEGTVTHNEDLTLMAGRTGVARLALATGAPVICCAVWGTHACLPRRRKARWRPGLVIAVRAGTPVDLSQFAGKPMDAQTLQGATTAVMEDLSALVADVRLSWKPPRWARLWPEVENWRPSGSEPGGDGGRKPRS